VLAFKTALPCERTSLVADAATLWKPGQSGNPAGRPLGSRNKFSEAAHADLVARVRMTGPSTYMWVCFSILLWPRLDCASLEHRSGRDHPRAAATLRIISSAEIVKENGSLTHERDKCGHYCKCQVAAPIVPLSVHLPNLANPG
jgi:hypothetical protein